MRVVMKYLIISVAGYLLGSLNMAIFTSKLMGGDVRKHGSGNAGATNMARIYGIGCALFTLLGDMLKSVAAMWLGFFLCGDVGLAVGGIACMLGHCFPVFHAFRGGKGVAVGGIVGMMIDWRVGLCTAAAFFIASLLTKKVSLGSCSGAIAVVAASLLFKEGEACIVLAVVSAVIVLVQHRDNLRRVIEGTEPDFKAAKPCQIKQSLKAASGQSHTMREPE